MNKRIFLAFLLAVVLFLSGCSPYSSDYVGRLEDEWSEKLLELEEERDLYMSKLNKVYDSLSVMEDPIATLYCYFEDEPYVTRKEAEDAFSIIHEELKKYY